MLKKFGKNKGFTLIELIVILAVLAIFASVSLVALTGWVTKAKNNSLIADCRSCVISAQTLVIEEYSQNSEPQIPDFQKVKSLSGVNGEVSEITLLNARIATLTYTDTSNNKSVTYILSPGPQYVFSDSDKPVLSAQQAIEKTVESMKSVSNLKGSFNVYSTVQNDRSGNYSALTSALSPEVIEGLSDCVWTAIIDSKGCVKELIVYNGTASEFSEQTGTFSVTLYDIKNSTSTQKNGYKGTSQGESIINPYVW